MEYLSDEQLIQRYKEGDSEAFNFLVIKYKESLFTYIYQMLRDRSLAEDVFQEVFLKVVRNINRYKEKNSFKNWLYKIAYHQVIDVLRKTKKRGTVSLEKIMKSDPENPVTLKDTLSSKAPLPEDILQRKTFGEDLEDAISSLSFQQREVFLLREYSNLSFKEISSMLRCPLNTVLGRMHYALKNLRLKLSIKYKEK